MSDELNRSQVVIPFGVGATYDYLNYTAISLSVDEWPIQDGDNSFKKLVINNPRLLNFINKRMKDLEEDKFKWVSYLLHPPIANDRHKPREMREIMNHMPVAKFPEWYVCSRCGIMTKPHPTSAEKAKCSNNSHPGWLNGSCHEIPMAKKPFLEPSRFVAFCDEGHLQDVPWKEIMQSSCNEGCSEMTKPDPKLYLADDGNGLGFSSLNLTCGSCNSRKNLSELSARNRENDQNSILVCKAKKPWLKESETEQCEKFLSIDPRGASRIYFPYQETGLFIPEPISARHPIQDEEQYKVILDSHEEDDKEYTIKSINRQLSGLAANLEPILNEEEIFKLIEKEFKNRKDVNDGEIVISKEKDDFYFEEFEVLTSNYSSDEYESKKMEMSEYSEFTKKFIFSLHSVNKLKATNVLLGFSRGGAEGKFNPARNERKFLPAFEVYGEGIFLNLGYEKIKSWISQNTGFKKNEKVLKKRIKDDFRVLSENYTDSGYIMLHTLSHILMRQLSLECGYGINEIKERIYFSHENKMAGILIYTSSDSSGSLGGLVRMARAEHFDGMLQNAINNSFTCSSDPICAESEGQGLGGFSFAACHACTMIPDLACEQVPKNIFLDRTTIIGSEENLKGYFS